MTSHKCGSCHLLFRYQTELDAHIRDEHLTRRARRGGSGGRPRSGHSPAPPGRAPAAGSQR
jgi:hypothetical protein